MVPDEQLLSAFEAFFVSDSSADKADGRHCYPHVAELFGEVDCRKRGCGGKESWRWFGWHGQHMPVDTEREMNRQIYAPYSVNVEMAFSSAKMATATLKSTVPVLPRYALAIVNG